MPITNFTGKPLGSFATLSASNAVTLTYPEGTDFVLLEAHQHDVRITFDGTTPTTSLGFLIKKDTPYVVNVGKEATIKLCSVSDDPAIYVQSFRKMEDVNT